MLFDPPLVVFFGGFGLIPDFQMWIVIACARHVIGLIDIIKVSFLIVGLFSGRISLDFVLYLFLGFHQVILADWRPFSVFVFDLDPVKVCVLGEARVDFDGFGLFAILFLVKD